MGGWLEGFKQEQMRDPEFRREYENLDFEFQVRQILVDARLKAGKTQEDVSEKMHTKQSAISRWERSPDQMTLKNLKEYADAVGAKINITLEQ